MFTMRRGALTVVVNFGELPQQIEVDASQVIFETESGVELAGRRLALPPHAGALVGQ